MSAWVIWLLEVTSVLVLDACVCRFIAQQVLGVLHRQVGQTYKAGDGHDEQD